MGLLEIGKGALWLTGKTLQGTAWLTSKVIEEATGVDLYGSAKELFTLGTDQSFAEMNQEGVMLKEREYAIKRAEILKKNLPNFSDEHLLNYEYEKLLHSYREVEVYMHELNRRGLTIQDSGFDDFVERMLTKQTEDKENEEDLYQKRIRREKEKEELEMERLPGESISKKQNYVPARIIDFGSPYWNLSDDELMQFDFTKLKSYEEIQIYMNELASRNIRRTDDDFVHYRSALKKKKLLERYKKVN